MALSWQRRRQPEHKSHMPVSWHALRNLWIRCTLQPLPFHFMSPLTPHPSAFTPIARLTAVQQAKCAAAEAMAQKSEAWHAAQLAQLTAQEEGTAQRLEAQGKELALQRETAAAAAEERLGLERAKAAAETQIGGLERMVAAGEEALRLERQRSADLEKQLAERATAHRLSEIEAIDVRKREAETNMKLLENQKETLAALTADERVRAEMLLKQVRAGRQAVVVHSAKQLVVRHSGPSVSWRWRSVTWA